ncbi:hypothetical protein BTTOUR_02280 [Bacillus thuringiensis serovar toumanoffi]|uniref:GNAT family N-acetyltransferase n=1 Tax=Bacillus thuringiensis serovar toumanoffi TaxID=180862 RepID=A0ABD5HRR4_BACTU|nr:hypothetical protein [Bacillus thuringiensis serovar toumanoffi]
MIFIILLFFIFMTFCLDPRYQFRPYTVLEYVIVNEDFKGNGINR